GRKLRQAGRKSHLELKSRYRPQRPDLNFELDVLTLQRPLSVQADLDLEARRSRQRQPDRRGQQQRRSREARLRPAAQQPRHQTRATQPKVCREAPGGCRRPTPWRRRIQSARGVATESRHSWTTSSPRTRCTHSSGRSVIRWARAGTATAFTSSGTTKSRRCSAARLRVSLRTAREPRGLAPTWTRVLSRVAVTTSTMYRPTEGSTWTRSIAWRIASRSSALARGSRLTSSLRCARRRSSTSHSCSRVGYPTPRRSRKRSSCASGSG